MNIFRKLHQIIKAPERLDQTAQRVAVLEEELRQARAALESRAEETRSELERFEGEILEGTTGDLWFDRLLGRTYTNRERMTALKTQLSINSTVWGSPDRLRIDPAAAVGACLLNTNGGTITVGAETFAGSGVSLLAGTHDPEMTGRIRMEEDPEAGADIVIGRGVWLCSGCTVLGPCTVGDHAVIAAGAVVTPGTAIPEGTVWAGIPARQIRDLKEDAAYQECRELTDGDPDGRELRSPELKAVFARNNGVLFGTGWFRRETDRGMTGYRMTGRKAEILVSGREDGTLRLRYRVPEGGKPENRLTVYRRDRKEEFAVTEAAGEIALSGLAGSPVTRLTLELAEDWENLPGNGAWTGERIGLFMAAGTEED